MLMTRFIVWILSVSIMIFSTGAVSGQNYPNRPIRIVTGAAGGASDIAARIIAQGISGPMGQQVVVDNRGGTTTSAEVVTKAPPDGYSILYATSNIWLAPFLRDQVAYDPVKDLSAITLAIRAPNILVIHPSVAANSVKELIALVKAKPGELNYASSNIGGASHLAAELFKTMADVNIMHIPYKGAGPAINDLIAGQVQVMFPTLGGVVPHVNSGRLRALAVTTAQPSELFPGLPTVAATGLPGYEAVSVNGIFAPAKTPAAIIKRLNQEIVRFLKTPEAKERFLKIGSEIAPSSPEEFAALVKSEMARLGKLIKDTGIREE
jgi:tripartite-type tricarboxylate transporter receptor subunit TctC